METEENKANHAKEIEEEDTVLIATTENKFNNQVRRKLLLGDNNNDTMLISIGIENDGSDSKEPNENQENRITNKNNNNEENNGNLIDLQSEHVQNLITEQDRNEAIREEINMNEEDENQDEEEDMIAVPQEIARDLINNNAEWRQAIILQINATNHIGRMHRFLPLGQSQHPNPYGGNMQFYAQWNPNVSENQVREISNNSNSSDKDQSPYKGNRYSYAQWDPNVSENQDREFLNENDSSDEEISWGRNSDEDKDQCCREEEKIFDINDSDDWIADLGASTHICNSDEGMYQCCQTSNQYMKVGNGNRLPILKKGIKRCVILQKSGKKMAVTLHNANIQKQVHKI